MVKNKINIGCINYRNYVCARKLTRNKYINVPAGNFGVSCVLFKVAFKEFKAKFKLGKHNLKICGDAVLN